MKPNSNKYKKFLVGVAIVSGILILGFYVYLNSSYRARVEHGIELPTRYSELETYGTFWQFWRSCARHSSTFFEIPKEDSDGYVSQFKVLMEVSVDSVPTCVIPGMQEYLEPRGEDFRITYHAYIESKSPGFHHEMYMIENSWKMILGFWTMLPNPCD